MCIPRLRVSAPWTLAVLVLGSSIAQAQDPGRRGEWAVAHADYNRGNSAVTLPDFDTKVEFQGRVYYPRSQGHRAFPLIVIMHGRHEAVVRGTEVGFSWPPTNGYRSFPNYLGHARLSRHLASHGFVVATISANGIASGDFGATGYRGQVARARLVQRHLAFLAQSNSGGTALGNRLAGKIDMEQIGLLGHSRGAEAMLVNSVINNGDAANQLQASSSDPTFPGAPNDRPEYDIDAVFACAPSTIVDVNVFDTPLAVMVGYCDGDVDLAGVRHYEASLYTGLYNAPGRTDKAPKHLIYVMGANHNFFNENWIPGRFHVATRDDVIDRTNARRDCHTLPFYDRTTGVNLLSGRLRPGVQLRVLDGYATAFFETYLARDTASAPVLTGEDIQPFRSLRLNPEDVLVSYTGPDDVDRRFDINRYDSVSHLNRSTGFGTQIVYENFNYFLGGGPSSLNDCSNGGTNPPFTTVLNRFGSAQDSRLEPHARGNRSFGSGAVRLTTFNKPGAVTHQVSAAVGDIDRFDAIQFRIGLHFEFRVADEADAIEVCERRQQRDRMRRSRCRDRSEGVLPDAEVAVELVDSMGRTQRINASDYSPALFLPPGSPDAARLVMNQVRIPLDAFSDVDRTALAQIRILVGSNNDIQVSDLALVSGNPFVGSDL